VEPPEVSVSSFKSKKTPTIQAESVSQKQQSSASKQKIKRTTTTVNETLSDEFNQGNYIYLSEYLSEQLYSFLLCRLCVFKHSLDEKLAL